MREKVNTGGNMEFIYENDYKPLNDFKLKDDIKKTYKWIETKRKIKKWAWIIGIIIFFALFFYGVLR